MGTWAKKSSTISSFSCDEQVIHRSRLPSRSPKTLHVFTSALNREHEIFLEMWGTAPMSVRRSEIFKPHYATECHCFPRIKISSVATEQTLQVS